VDENGLDSQYEADLYAPLMQEANLHGARLFRNHVGAARQGKDERVVRHGLPAGSSDLIGWTWDGRFLAVEVKRPGWRPTPKWGAGPQARFIEAVRRAGGVAGVARSREELRELLRAG
jgi:hypothetical protein